jgi:hypothetical protein
MATVSAAATHRGHEPPDPLITGLPEEHHAHPTRRAPRRRPPPEPGKTKIEKNVKVTALV